MQGKEAIFLKLTLCTNNKLSCQRTRAGKQIKEEQRMNEFFATLAGIAAGAVAGGMKGATIGIAAGPLGAIAGTVPCAIVGGIIGGLTGNNLGHRADENDW